MTTHTTGETHPLKRGVIVEVHDSTLGGKEVVERATIVSPIKDLANRYNVRFHGDGHNVTYPRFVLPEHEIKA